MPKSKQDCELLISKIGGIHEKLHELKDRRTEFSKQSDELFTATLREISEKITELKSSDAIKSEHRQYETILTQLNKTYSLLSKMIDEDMTRIDKIQELKQKAEELLKLATPGSDELDGIYKQIKTYGTQVDDLYELILENQKRLNRYIKIADSYDEAKPQEFKGYLLQAASVILERDSEDGFTGTIDYKDLGTRQTPGTGFEAGSSVSYGVFLKPEEVIRYTHKDYPKIKIEQDHTGKITDKSTYTDTDPQNSRHKQQVAKKIAKLLLMDSKLRNDPNMYITGPAAVLDQTKLVIAELKALDPTIDMSKIVVKVPGWSNFSFKPPGWSTLGRNKQETLNQEEKSPIYQKLKEIKGLAEGETVHSEPKPNGPTNRR
jgi:hypothetical protein